MPRNPQSGQVEAPIASPRAGGYKPGDQVTINGKTFNVTGIDPKDGRPVLHMAPSQPDTPSSGQPSAQPSATPTQPKAKYGLGELADLYKKQNPQFRNVDDVELVNRILRDHPETIKRLELGKEGGTTVKWKGGTPQITAWGTPAAGRASGPMTEAMGGIAAQKQAEQEEWNRGVQYAGSDQLFRDFFKDVAPMAAFPLASRMGVIKGALTTGAASALGGAGGEALDRMTGAPKPEGSFLSRRAEDALWGAGTEVGGRALGTVMRGAARPMRMALGGSLQDAPSLSRENIASKYGIHFTPSQVFSEQSDILGGPKGIIFTGEESRATHNPYSRSIARAGAKERGKAAYSTVAGLADQLGPEVSPHITGSQMARVIERVGKPVWQHQVERLKSIVNAKARGTMVDVTSLRDEAERELEEMRVHQIRIGQVDDEGRAIIPATAKVKMLKEISMFPEQMPFADLVTKRSQWMGVSPQIIELVSSDAKGTAKHYTQLSTKLLDDAAKGAPASMAGARDETSFLRQAIQEITGQQPHQLFDLPAPTREAVVKRAQQLKEAAGVRTSTPARAGFTEDWNRFRNFTRKGADVFESQIITDAVNKNPEEVVGLLKNDSITDAIRVRRAIKDYASLYGTTVEKARSEAAWRKFQVAFLRDNIIGPLDGDMTKLAGALDNISSPMKKVLFDDPQAKATFQRLREVATAMRDADKGMGVLMGHQDPLADATSAKGWFRSIRPYVVAKIAWNPTATRLFLRGIQGLAENPPKDSAIRKWVDSTLLGSTTAKAAAKSSKAALSVGGYLNNRRLGAAMADIIRAYDIANIYDESKANDERANDAFKRGQIDSAELMKREQGSTPVPELRP